MANGNASFRGLSALSGYSTSKVYGISGDGRVAVGSSYTDSDTAQACIWTAQNVIGLGTLQDYPYGEAYAASKDGSVVGGTCNFHDIYLAFRWNATDGIQKVPSLNPNFTANTIQGVSADGTVLVGIGGGGYAPQACRWTAPDKLKEMGFLTSVKSSAALGLSAVQSLIVGQSANDKGMSQPVIWPGTGGIITLPLLAGSIGGVAFGVSGDGTVCVGSSSITNNTYQATLWNAKGAVSLGNLPGGQQACAAYAASFDGSIIVGFTTTNNGEEAFIWDNQNGMRNLRDVLISYGLGNQLQGWQLHRASAISYTGSAIAGYGANPNGLTTAFLATLP